jgi:NADH-quinone oxidoreductase subunit N|nr:MAG: NADH-quinone oxidoreductase subunit N [Thermoproteus sp. AZ2]
MNPLILIAAALAALAPLALRVEGRYLAAAFGVVVFAAAFFAGSAAFFFAVIGVLLIAMALDWGRGALGYALGLSGVATALAGYAYVQAVSAPQLGAEYIFIAIAALAISTTGIYGLLASGRGRDNVEGAVKYLVFSGVGKALILAGFVAASYISPALGWSLIIVGFMFELGIVPAHAWVVDSFALSSPKGVAALALFGEVSALFTLLAILRVSPPPAAAGLALLIISLISMTFANVAGLTARTYGRTLAYSSIAHMSYALAAVGLIAYLGNRLVSVPLIGTISALSLASLVVLLEAFASGIAKAGLFNALTTNNADLGPERRALSNAVNALSLLGVPPLLGFWPKLFLVLLSLAFSQVGVAIVVVLNSAIAAPYYLRVFRQVVESAPPGSDNTTSVLAATLSIALGVLIPVVLAALLI